MPHAPRCDAPTAIAAPTSTSDPPLYFTLFEGPNHGGYVRQGDKDKIIKYIVIHPRIELLVKLVYQAQ